MRLLLFVAGDGFRARRAEEDLRRILGSDANDVQVVDVLNEPGRAEDHGVLATPTLVRVHPPPDRRVIGDLGDGATVRRLLGLPRSDGVEAGG